MVISFGSVNVDLVVPVPALPQPGETVLGGDYLILPGGKGANQALAARRAGSDVALAGAVGSDRFAEIALGQLKRCQVDTSLVRTVAHPTGCAAIMVSSAGDNMIAVAPGANLLARSDQVPDGLLGSETILLVQGEVPFGQTHALIRRAARRGAQCLLNLAPMLPIDPELFPVIDLLIVNEGEAGAIGTDPRQLALRLRQGLVITCGPQGATALLADGACLQVPALPIEPVDTTGAGDSFAGVLAAGLDLGRSLEQALWRASAAAALACLEHGAQSAMPDAAAIDSAVRTLQASQGPGAQ